MTKGYKKFSATIIVLLTSACANMSKETPIDNMAKAKAIHESALVLDAHADIEIPGKEDAYAGEDGLSKVEPNKMRTGRVDAVVMAIAVGPGPRTAAGYIAARKTADEELAAIIELTSNPDDDIVLVRSAEELETAHANNQRALILSFQNARILGTDVSAIDDFYRSGVRVFALTHMGHNDFADSSRPVFVATAGKHEVTEEHGGLSDLGRQAIARINELGAIVDVSQLSKAATLEVLSLTTAPIIASHSNVQALSDVSRNLTDEEIDKIAENGGVIHVAPFRGYLFDSTDKALDRGIRAARITANIREDYFYPFDLYWEIKDPDVKQTFLSTVSGLLGPGSVDDLLNHIDYIVKRVGIDHVGIGTDFNHGSGIEGYNDASEALNVTIGLLDRGYSQAEVEKIWGGNFLRVFSEVK
ncbi:MAG: membrane dipeptidase [Candidatus Azotimanducaceae bacterium]|jgi:membrane dipeptidase